MSKTEKLLVLLIYYLMRRDWMSDKEITWIIKESLSEE